MEIAIGKMTVNKNYVLKNYYCQLVYHILRKISTI